MEVGSGSGYVKLPQTILGQLPNTASYVSFDFCFVHLFHRIGMIVVLYVYLYK